MPRIAEDREAGMVTFTVPYHDLTGLLRDIASYIENQVDEVTDLAIWVGEQVPGDGNRDLFRHRAVLYVDTWNEE
jgi:hypothetical protein